MTVLWISLSYIGADVQIGNDSIVYPNVVLEGKTVIGSNNIIGMNCRFVDSKCTVLNRRLIFVHTIIIASNGAAADIYTAAHHRITHIREMGNLAALSHLGFFDLYKISNLHMIRHGECFGSGACRAACKGKLAEEKIICKTLSFFRRKRQIKVEFTVQIGYYRDIQSLNLLRMQIHSQHAASASFGDQVCYQFRCDWLTVQIGYYRDIQLKNWLGGTQNDDNEKRVKKFEAVYRQCQSRTG